MNEDQAKAAEDILDVAQPVSVPMPTPWWVWAAIVLAVLLIAALVVWLVRRKKPEVRVSAKEKALRQLDSLRERAPHLDGHQFGVAVSDVIREYLTEARQLRATQQTSAEFLAELRQTNLFSPVTQERLKEFLEACDYLKFAPVGHATEPNRNLLEQAHQFIRGEA